MKQPVDSFFNKKLKNYNAEAPASAWNRIDANLSQKKKPLLWLKIAASLLIITLVGFAIYTSMDHPVEQLATANKTTPVENEVIKEDTGTTPVQEKDEEVPAQKEIPQPTRLTVANAKKVTPVKIIEKDQFIEPVELTHSSTQLITENTIDHSNEVIPVELESEIINTPVETTTILISAEEANAKYLNQQFIADATPENKKSSKLRNLFEKAQDLDPIGEIRQLKNEVLALNFRNEKKGERNR
jgi:hypothetical protein